MQELNYRKPIENTLKAHRIDIEFSGIYIIETTDRRGDEMALCRALGILRFFG